MQKPILWLTLFLLAFFISGCMPQVPIYRPIPKPKPVPKPIPESVQRSTSKPVIKRGKTTQIHEIKEVQDNNFDPDYMYPETSKRHNTKQAVSTSENTAVTQSITKEECIGMIGEARYDRYTQMLGSETAAIKRCALLKSMQ